MTLIYASLAGTSTINFETWRSGTTDYDLQAVHRETLNNGEEGGFDIQLDTPPLEVDATGIIEESSLATLKAMKGETVTVSIHNETSTFTAKIRNIVKLNGLNPVSVSAANVVTTTYDKRKIRIILIREV